MYIFLVSFRGQTKLGPRPNRSPLGVQFKISDEHPHPFNMRSPPPPGSMLSSLVFNEKAIEVMSSVKLLGLNISIDLK